MLQKEEIESGNFQDVDNIIRMTGNELFTPDGLYVLERYVREKSGLRT